MLIGDLLMAHGLVTKEDIELAYHRQKENGGKLGDNLVALGIVSQDDVDRIIYEAPQAPKTLSDTGIPTANLLRLLFLMLTRLTKFHINQE